MYDILVTSLLRHINLKSYNFSLILEKIAEVWAKERSILTLRKLFEAKKAVNESANAEDNIHFESEKAQLLPDLVLSNLQLIVNCRFQWRRRTSHNLIFEHAG